LKLGARSVGAMKLALGQSVQYAKERHQFGQPIANFGLIKQKLAEMAIRTYVGEAILYRTLGMIDEALERADKDDAQQVLAVLEQYAIECSIIKVWESESLGVVVDEQVQVYGGYGYSKDYPAERAYRDARIARIYEGTNEINRIVIATQLLRRAKSGELSLLDAAECVLKGADQTHDTITLSIANVAFSDEVMMVRSAKALTLMAIGNIAQAYGDAARNEQEMLALASDMVMDVYAMESALLRTQKLMLARGKPSAAIQSDITRVFIREVMMRVERAARLVAAETADGDRDSTPLIEGLIHRAPIKTTAARRRVADAVITAGKYNL
jgi:alkylation response protein AidB-like acyl-CoA dehydrogenase